MEGLTEKKVVPKWAKKLKLDFRYVEVISFEGTQEKPMARVLEEVLRNTQATLFVMMDAGREENVNELVEKGYVKRENTLVLDGCLEDTYPLKLIEGFLAEQCGKPKEEIKIDLERKREDEIKRILGEAGKSDLLERNRWKVPLREYVARKMKAKDIDLKIKEFLSKVAKGADY